MKFELIKGINKFGRRNIDVYCEDFVIEVYKDVDGEITAGGVIQKDGFSDRDASIRDLEALHQGFGEALRIANNFEKYWNRN